MGAQVLRCDLFIYTAHLCRGPQRSLGFRGGQVATFVVQSLSMSNSLWPHELQHTRLPCPYHLLLKLMSIELVMPSNYLILCCPLLLLPSAFPSHQCLFQWIGSSHQVAKVLELQLQYQSFQWIFKVDFLLDWLVWSPCCPRALKSLLQLYNSKVSVLWCLAFFMVQLSHLYMTTGKAIASTKQTFGCIGCWFLGRCLEDNRFMAKQA